MKSLIRVTSGLNDKIVAVSEAARTAEIESSRVPSDKVITIYNGLDPTPYISVSDDSRHTMRNSLRIPDEVLLLGAVGRLHPAKGIDDLIAAIGLLESKTNSIHLLIVGEGELEDQLKLES